MHCHAGTGAIIFRTVRSGISGSPSRPARCAAYERLRSAWTRPSTCCSSPPPCSTRSGTAATMRGRPWASLQRRCTRRAVHRRRPRSTPGGARLPIRDSAGNGVRRLAHRAYDAVADRPAEPGAGLLRRHRRRHHAVPGDIAGRAGLDDAHDHGHDRRSRRGAVVRWSVVGNIVVAWVVTLPAAIGISAGCYVLIGLLTSGATRVRQDMSTGAEHPPGPRLRSVQRSRDLLNPPLIDVNGAMKPSCLAKSAPRPARA